MPNPAGSGFTNLNKLISANQDNQLGNAIQGGVQKNVQGLQGNISQAQQQFQTDVNNANLNTAANQQYVQNTIGNIVNAPANINAPQGQTAPTPGNSVTNTAAPTPQAQPGMMAAFSSNVQPSSNPAQQAQTPQAPSKPAPASTTPATTTPTGASGSDVNSLPGSFGASNATSGANTTSMQGQGFNAPTGGDISKFGNLAQGTYSGPNQLANYQTLQAQAQNLQNQGQEVGSQGGLQSLLQRYVGGPSYTQGQQTLDTLLLGQTGQPQLQNIAKSLQNIGQQPLSAESQAEGLAQQTATGNQAFGRNVQNQIASAETPILQNIQQNLNTINSQNQSYQDIGKQIFDYLNNPVTSGNTPQATPKSAAPAPSRIMPGGWLGTGGMLQRTPVAQVAPHAAQQVIPGQSAPTTKSQAAIDALNLAAQNGMITADQLNTLSPLLKQAQTGGGDLQKILGGAFNYNPQSQLPQYTLQQGANAQQAAQLNALNQLAGVNQQFGTYGGLTLPSYGFDMSKIPGANVASGASAITGTRSPSMAYDLSQGLLMPINANLNLNKASLGAGEQMMNDITTGNLVGAGQDAINAPAQVTSNLTGSITSGAQGLGDATNKVFGGIPGVTEATGIANQAAGIPLDTINGVVGGISGGTSGALQNLSKGNISGSMSSALSGLESAVSSPVSAIGHALCFVENTPILMEDGTYKKVQDLELMDDVKYGGKVIGQGVALCSSLVEYKGRMTSLNHTIFDGNRFVRAKYLNSIQELDTPVRIYPIVSERHILISDNGVVYCDLVEVDNTEGWSYDDKIRELNTPKYLEQAIFIERNINGRG